MMKPEASRVMHIMMPLRAMHRMLNIFYVHAMHGVKQSCMTAY